MASPAFEQSEMKTTGFNPAMTRNQALWSPGNPTDVQEKAVFYPRTSTRISLLQEMDLDLSGSEYEHWARHLTEPPKKLKVRGTKKALSSFIAGMVPKRSKKTAPQFQGGYDFNAEFLNGQFVKFNDSALWYGNESFAQERLSRRNGIAACNCFKCCH